MPVSADARCPAHAPQVLKAVDAAGQVWAHRNPAELYRWVSRRNELLGAIAGAPRPQPRG